MRRRPSAPPDKRKWWNAAEGEVHRVVCSYVEQVERQQFDVFNRFVQLEYLYDPHAPNLPAAESTDEAEAVGLMIENVIASNVDAVTAQIATTEVRPRFMTDGGDWTQQQTATKLEWYAEGVGKLLDIPTVCELAFRECAKKGTGFVKVFVDSFDEVKLEHVRVDDIVVDEAECRSGKKPRQLHHRLVNVDREELKAQFPEFEEQIDRAQTGQAWTGRMWGGYRPIIDDGLVAIESWRLPIGRKGHDGYRPGRHTIVIDGVDLLDEEWHKPFFPFACIVWSDRTTGFYGISLAEGISGHQRAINKRNWQIDMNLDTFAVPVTYVDMADANLAVQSIDRMGTVCVVKGQRPTTVTPTANNPEVYAHRNELKSSASEMSGVSRMASQAVQPAGIDSGVGLRELHQQVTQRFASQEKRFQRLVLDTYWHVIDRCKDLGADAPVISRKAKFGTKKMTWADVDMGDVRVQIAAASTLSRTPAGRYQIALEWAQAGVITTDEWRRLTKHPDLDHILSLYTQGMESVERDIEAIRDGKIVVPEPLGNLQLMARMAQMAYLRDSDIENVPESVLEGMNRYAVLAAKMFSDMQAANQNAAMPLGAAPGAPMSGVGPDPGRPVAALAPEAAQAMAA